MANVQQSESKMEDIGHEQQETVFKLGNSDKEQRASLSTEESRVTKQVNKTRWNYVKILFVYFLLPFSPCIYDTWVDINAWSRFYPKNRAGIVYGAVDQDAIAQIGGFCFFGIALLILYAILEFLNTARLIRRAKKQNLKKDCRNDDARKKEKRCRDEKKADIIWKCFQQILVIVMFILEDIPEDINWLIINSCRERHETELLLLKVVSGLFLFLIVTILQGIVLFKSNLKRQERWPFCLKILRWIVFVVMIVQLFISIILACLYFYTWDNENSLSPKGFHLIHYPGYINRDRYLNDVSVFLKRAGEPAAWHSNDSSQEWMRLFYIKDIIKEKQIMYKFKYQTETSGTVNMATWMKFGMAENNWTISGCYRLNQFIEQTRPCPDIRFMGADTYYMKFRYVSNETYSIGQILFNVKVEQGGTAWDWNTYTLARNLTRTYSDMFHYFRHCPNRDSFLYKTLFQRTTFYHANSSELTDVVGIWRTGLRMCRSEATLWPVLDPTIDFILE